MSTNRSVVDGHKVCTGCGESLPVDRFGRRGGKTRHAHHLRSKCRDCDRRYHRDYRRAMDPRQKRDEWLRYEYGITLEEYERRHEEQRGVCALCDRSNGARPLVVDHDHQTGEVRGLLCDRCNKALGLLEDDEVRLRRAINYVRRQA